MQLQTPLYLSNRAWILRLSIDPADEARDSGL